MKKIQLIMLLLFVSMSTGVFASSGTKGMEFLKLGADARGNSLSGSGIANPTGLEALYWNPSALAGIKGLNAMATYFNWPGDMTYIYLAYGMPFLVGKIGASVTFLNEGGLDQTQVDANSLGDISSYDLAVSVAYGLKLGKISAGGAIRMITQKVMGESGTGAVIDAGAVIPFLAKDKLKTAVVVKNIGFSSKYKMTDMPMAVQIGGSYTEVIKDNMVSVMASGDIGSDSFVNFGAEYGYREAVYLRAGYKYDLSGNSLAFPKGLSVGFGGFIAPFGLKGISADVTWIPMGDLGQSIQTTLAVKF